MNDRNDPARTPCPPWCARPGGCGLFHEAVLGRFGAVLGVASTVDVGQIPGEHEPTVNVWSKDHTSGFSTEVVRLTPGEAATLARALGALVSIDDFDGFRRALSEAAQLLDGQGDEVNP